MKATSWARRAQQQERVRCQKRYLGGAAHRMEGWKNILISSCSSFYLLYTYSKIKFFWILEVKQVQKLARVHELLGFLAFDVIWYVNMKSWCNTGERNSEKREAKELFEHKTHEGPKIDRGHTGWSPKVWQCTGACWCTSCGAGRIHHCDCEKLYHTINGNPCHMKGQLRHKEGVRKLLYRGLFHWIQSQGSRWDSVLWPCTRQIQNLDYLKQKPRDCRWDHDRNQSLGLTDCAHANQGNLYSPANVIAIRRDRVTLDSTLENDVNYRYSAEKAKLPLPGKRYEILD